MATILNKYRKPLNSPLKPSIPSKPSGVGRNTSSAAKRVKSYDAYMRLLEEAMQKNANSELSESQIQHFISVNKLDSDWEITAVEIRKDMKMVLAKFARHERTENFGRNILVVNRE